jgi:serine/threonine protein kinase
MKHIVHLDVRPGNILLDESMMPKIKNFGMRGDLEYDKYGVPKIKNGSM